jgi:glycosyltransferase involved in cell wall biosynthesis
MVVTLCSTIIPTVNRSTLKRAVSSALEQSIPPDLHEIIVVNDSGGPLPKTEWLSSPQVKVIDTNRCERSVARNVGAAVARGKYLQFLDDDDYLLPRALEALVQVAEASSCAWVYGALRRIAEDGTFISVNRPEVRGNLFALLVIGETLSLAPSLILREAFWRVAGFDPQLTIAEDRDLACRQALNYEFDRADTEVVCARVGPARSTTDWTRMTYASRLVREKALDLQGGVARLQRSIGNNAHLRGRVCQAITISALLNAKAGHACTASSRLSQCFRIAVPSVIMPKFWSGLMEHGEREG